MRRRGESRLVMLVVVIITLIAAAVIGMIVNRTIGAKRERERIALEMELQQITAMEQIRREVEEKERQLAADKLNEIGNVDVTDALPPVPNPEPKIETDRDDIPFALPTPREAPTIPSQAIAPPGLPAPKPSPITEELIDGQSVPYSGRTANSGGGSGRRGRERTVRNTERYEAFNEQPFALAGKDRLKTFSADVNTASYSNVRRLIEGRQHPPRDAVRIAELVNYFDYQYPIPKDDAPVAFGLELAPCPWQPDHKLLRIALRAKTYSLSELPPRNLVFLVDTSGSMSDRNKLPLVKESLKLLVNQLNANDRAAIVTYAGSVGVALEPTPGDQKEKILAAIAGLSSEGSTNGEGGIVAAYDLASKNFLPGGINRVILMTDGDFNVGISDPKSLHALIESKRKTGVFLTVLGFGYGNLKDQNLETLARHGNGHYGYIDSIREAQKVFVDQGAALVTVAKDVKLQVEFSPERVQAYRLIGYENRQLRNEDFRDDAKDAGEMGSGHTVTALFEIVPHGVTIVPGFTMEQLKSGVKADASKPWATVRMRYKQPDGEVAQEVASTLPADGETATPSADFRFASAVAGWGLLLRQSPLRGKVSVDMIIQEATLGQGVDIDGLRGDFIDLVKRASLLRGN